MAAHFSGFRVRHYALTASTNADAREGTPGDVFWADEQTAGRGRLAHKWLSAPGENLTFTVVLSVSEAAPAEVATLPLVVGMAAVRALGKFAEGLSLKWPNDILCGGRKICGILCERHCDLVLVGIGLNVNQIRFAPEIADRATSLRLVTGRETDRAEVLSAILAALAKAVTEWRENGFAHLHPAFAQFDALKGQVVSVFRTDDDSAPAEGVCGGIQPDGSLLVAGERIWAGEAHVGAAATQFQSHR